ncbi:MAG: sodium:solute symporter family protein [Deltaproteobacteria bacterium]|nr:sodium:solute symporter family protein [Deltaproteobacteria bacterium]
MPVFVLTMFSTWYGGILGVGEFGYMYGISSWLLQGVPYYFFAIVFAFVFAARARRMEVSSTPEQIAKVYGLQVGRLSALFTMILASPAPYILMIAVLLQLMMGLSLFTSLLISVIFSIGYLVRGGFRADRYTDVVFGVMMFLGFLMFVGFLFFEYGSVLGMRGSMPPNHFIWHGGNPPQFIIMWFLIALWTWVEPSFYQRCYAAKSDEVAKKGILWSVFFWFLFDILTMATALYARAILPALRDPMLSYPALADFVLPPVAKGFFFVSLLATILSTLNSQFFVSSIAIGRDFLFSFFPKRYSETRWIQIGLFLMAGFSIVLALLIPSVVKLWYTIGTIMIPGLLLPMVTSFFTKSQVRSEWMFASQLFGFTTSLICLLWGWSDVVGSYDQFPFGVEPIFPGLVVAIAFWGAGMIHKIKHQSH